MGNCKTKCGNCDCAPAPETQIEIQVIKPSNHNKRWSDEDVNFLIINYAAGADIHLIANELNRTVVSILHRLKQNGLVEFDKSEKAYFSVRAKLYQF